MKSTSKIFLSLALMSSLTASGFAAVPSAAAPQTTSQNTFATGDKTFLLNGKPFVVKAAEIHYPRIPRQYWEQVGYCGNQLFGRRKARQLQRGRCQRKDMAYVSYERRLGRESGSDRHNGRNHKSGSAQRDDAGGGVRQVECLDLKV